MPVCLTILLSDELNTTNPNGRLELHQTVFEDVDYEYYILRLNQGGWLIWRLADQRKQGGKRWQCDVPEGGFA